MAVGLQIVVDALGSLVSVGPVAHPVRCLELEQRASAGPLRRAERASRAVGRRVSCPAQAGQRSRVPNRVGAARSCASTSASFTAIQPSAWDRGRERPLSLITSRNRCPASGEENACRDSA